MDIKQRQQIFNLLKKFIGSKTSLQKKEDKSWVATWSIDDPNGKTYYFSIQLNKYPGNRGGISFVIRFYCNTTNEFLDMGTRETYTPQGSVRSELKKINSLTLLGSLRILFADKSWIEVDSKEKAQAILDAIYADSMQRFKDFIVENSASQETVLSIK